MGLELNRKHQLLDYANGVNMLGENLQTFRKNTEIFIKANEDIGFEVNSQKTKYMITYRQQNITQNPNVVTENLSFENVEKFKYLGVTLINVNNIYEEIKRRINMGNACYYSLEEILISCLLSTKIEVRNYYITSCIVWL